MKKKKTKQGNPYLVPAMSLLLAGMMVLALVLPDKAFSYTENRPLAASANVSWQGMVTGKSAEEMDIWFSDQIPGRNMFFHMDYLIRKACGQEEIKNVFLGNNALLSNPEKENKELISDTLQAIETFASQNGMNNYLLVAPPAAIVQPQKLPDNAPVRQISSTYDAIARELPSVHNVDIRDMLGEHKDEYIFYKTDHHWTTLGAGYAVQSLLEAMDIDMNPGDFKRMPVSHSFEGTLAAKTGSVFLKDQIDIAVSKDTPEYFVTWADGSKTASIYDRSALETRDKYQVFLSNNQSKIRIDTLSDSGRSLLLFKDSYANSAVQYLLPYFSSITIVDPRYYYDDLELVLGSDLFTDCAFLYSYDTFATISSLKDVLNAWNEEHVQ